MIKRKKVETEYEIFFNSLSKTQQYRFQKLILLRCIEFTLKMTRIQKARPKLF